MSRPRDPAEPTEQQFLGMVLQLAKLHRWRSIHVRPGRTAAGGWRTPVQGDGVGFVDCLLLRDSRLIAAELKSSRGTTTPEQDAWLKSFREVGAEVFIWKFSDWKEIEATLK